MKVLTDTGLVFAALWRCIVQHEQVTGEFHVVSFHGGGRRRTGRGPSCAGDRRPIAAA